MTAEKQDLLYRSHGAACRLIGLLILYCLLCCIGSWQGALQDMDKFRALGSSRPFGYYLETNDFAGNAGMLVSVSAELLLYIVLCRRAERRTLWYFAVMLVLHGAAWLHSHSLGPVYLLYTAVGKWAVYYRALANISILPACTYFILYAMRVRMNSE